MNTAATLALLGDVPMPTWWLEDTPPTPEQLNTMLSLPPGMRLSLQGASDLHYETQIATDGAIPTRPQSWHDAFNAWVWSVWPACKKVMNRLQAEDVARLGKERSRRQMAITHLDESGVIVSGLRAEAIAAWDAHDWPSFFASVASTDSARVRVIGHALLEHMKHSPRLLLTGKAILVDTPIMAQADLDRRLADHLADLLSDPQLLRALPVSGLPGAWPDQSESFYRDADCFRPLRPGKRYPPALVLE